MSSEHEAVVRRFYEELCNGRNNAIASEIFTADHVSHDPHVPSADGPDGVAESVKPYQEGVEGHWQIEDIFSSGDRVAVRWTGTGTHSGEVNGIPPTGNAVEVAALSVHRIEDGKIAETWTVWDTLSFMQQIGAVPTQAAAAN
ncbi:MAG: hypothetical protein QOK04_2755 [Solirubrobacteraceae bacterium]|jgi:steroid delta-isomerase-like uncharacterized protein|nr:hypothetical protein [Solirubrobacteraceae bacterium]